MYILFIRVKPVVFSIPNKKKRLVILEYHFHIKNKTK